MLPKQVIEEIINKADIVSIIGQRIDISKKGRNYWGVCPFHQDSNPSLSISPEKNIYKCFSCQVSGNVIDFVKAFDNLSFQKALIKVAEAINYDLSKFNVSNKNNFESDFEKIFKINNEALNFFKSCLIGAEGKVAVEYLQKRKINLKQIDKFDIGFISKHANLIEHLLSKKYTPKEIIDAGLGNYNEQKHKIINVFNDRLMFPIRNEDNKIIGFSGRKLEEKSERPKYLNTKETKVFFKRQIAYNFSSAVLAARVKKEIIVLEGYMDVIALDKIDMPNVIALMGTSLSTFHINLFKKLKDCEVKIFLDGDLPGVNASIKAASLLIENKIKTSIVYNQTQNDPDELISLGKIEYVQNIIHNTISPLDFVVEQKWRLVEKNKPDSIREFLTGVAIFVLKTSDQILYEKSIPKLTQLTGLNETLIINFFKDLQKSSIFSLSDSFKETNEKRIKTSEGIVNVLKAAKAYEKSELAVVEDLLRTNKNVDYIKSQIYEVNFENKNYRRIINKIIAIYNDQNNISKNDLIATISKNTPELSEIIQNITNSPEFKVKIKNTKKMLDDAFDKLRIRSNELEIEEIEKIINEENITPAEQIKLNDLLAKKIQKRELWKKKFSNR